MELDILGKPSEPASPSAEALFEAKKESIFESTNRLFAGLMVFQWGFCILLSLVVSPKTWTGAQSSLHPHVLDALLLGGCIASLPIYLGVFRPDFGPTRYIMSVAQMLMSALMIHLTGGRIETHFHVFGSLAFLAFYRDWKVLIPATLVVLIDHFARGIFIPMSVFGVEHPNLWRPVEHAGWVVFEDAFLIASCIRSTNEMRIIAVHTADLAGANSALRAEIEERLAAENALREASRTNQRLATAIEYSQVGVLISDGNGVHAKTIFINPAFTQITGYSEEQAIGVNCRMLQGPGTDPKVLEEIRAALRDATPFEGRLLNYRKDGRPFWNELRISPVFDEDGNVIHFVGLQSDVTDRVEAEAALVRSEERYRSVVNTTHEVLFQMDTEFHWSFLNRAWKNLTGYSVDECRHAHYLSFVHEDDRADVHERVTEVANSVRQEFRLEVRFNHKGDQYRWVDMYVRGWWDDSGKLAGFSGTLMDVTERKVAETEIVAARLEAEEANKAQSRLLSRMSHELRTPMNAILGFGQLLERQPLSTAQSGWVNHIVRSGHHLLGLIDEILDISGMDGGGLQLVLEPVSLTEVLEEAFEAVGPNARDRHIELRPLPPELTGLRVIADRQRLSQVFLNLMKNAVQYNVDGGWIRVSVENASEISGLRVSIQDCGIGIEPQALSRLFSPFERLGAEYSQVQGSGLGLAFCKYLVEAMRGEIALKSRPGEGSTVWVELPSADAPTGDSLNGNGAHDASRDELAGPSQTVLCIEDKSGTSSAARRIAEERPDARVLTASREVDGVEQARKQRPDAILLDMELPDTNAWDILRRLRTDDLTRHIPVIALCAPPLESREELALTAGATRCLTKPLDVKNFLQVVEEVLI